MFLFLCQINYAVRCFNPSPTLNTYKMQFVAGQNLTNKAADQTVLFIECQTLYLWLDVQKVKNITCINERWENLPTPCISMNLLDFRFLRGFFLQNKRLNK